MRIAASRTHVLGAVLLVLFTASSVLGQGDKPKPPKSDPTKPAPGSLEEALEKALRNNPDILAAEAKVRDAEAEANRVRQQVIAKVVTLRNEIDFAKKMVKLAEVALQETAELHRKGAATAREVTTARAALDKAEADLARAQADLQAVLGDWQFKIKNLAFSPDGKLLLEGTVKLWDPASALVVKHQQPQDPMAERIRKALDKTFKLNGAIEESPLKDILEFLQEVAGASVPFRILHVKEQKMSLMKGELPLGAWLQVVEDSIPDVRFLVREYGILVTTKDRVPEGAMRVHDFWRQKEKPKDTPDKKPEDSDKKK